MTIKLNPTRCRHCEKIRFTDINDKDLDKPRCAITNKTVNEKIDKCDKFSINNDVFIELKETVGFKDSEILVMN